ncbi:MAG TPA: ABC transporter ATP-binding protein [Opitutaceae bacterium]|nr:ABC transporter ATP-binding protein [Opitutaceae bacterium]
MSSDIVIAVENLSKRYVIGHEARHDNLRDALHHTARKLWRRFRWGTGFRTEEFWALRDVAFEVRRGEVVGIIGRNGAGKSTLLKILSRITEPTTGRVTLRGRVASLLEVGTGFHPELTGRENIFLNGAILGMRRDEIRRKFDEIVAFAEVDRFIDMPVKHYSSGMHVRLAFAVAAHLEPEILIIDEVLAVGDLQFQRKCLGKMQQVASGEGRTVLFVSHNTAAVQNLCSRGLVLESGRQRFLGGTADALALYVNSGGPTGGPAVDKQVAPPGSPVRCTSLTVNGSASDRLALTTSAESLEIAAGVQVTADVRLSIETYLCDRYGNKLALCSPGHDESGGDVHRLSPGHYRLTARIQLPRLFRGHYLLDITLVQPYVCKYVSFPCAIELTVDSSGLNWGRMFEDSGVAVGFMVLPGRVTAERLAALDKP